MQTLDDVLEALKLLANQDKINLKREKFGIEADNSVGVYHADLKKLAKQIGRKDELAPALFDSGIYEARLLCSMTFQTRSITPELMEKWVSSFENWEICDSFCMGFFAKSRHAIPKAIEWASRSAEFEKRAGFAIMAAYGFANKQAANPVFEQFFPIIEHEACDARTYVRKAVNWALRNIGKRNVDLHNCALETANRILKLDNKTARWIATDAIRQLQKPGFKTLDYPRAIYRIT